MTTKRRLLIVTDLGCSRYSALKRGLAYESLFASHPKWSAEYIDRNPPPARPLARNVFQRLAGRIGARIAPYARTSHRVPSRDDEILQRARTCDLVYLLKTPTIDLQRRILALNGPRVVVDVNDALWLSHHGEGFSQLPEMLSTAHGVICENPYVATYAKNHNPAIRIVPDCTQLDTFDSLRNTVSRNGATVRLGWIGSHSTAGSLYAIWEPLEELFTRHSNLELRILGAVAEHLPLFEKVRWSSVLYYDRERMAKEALAMDIGLFPLFRVEDSLARGNGKAVVYMAAGAVAACSNIGEHTRLIQDNVNGLLASDSQEWFTKLDRLITHPEELRRIGQAGLDTVRKELSDRVCFEHLIDALDFVVGARY
jgi:hypothetical protein